MGDLGELIVKITTDLTNLNAGLKAAEDKVKATSGKITELTNKIGITMTAIGTVVTGAFALMVKSSVDYADQLYIVSQQTGIAVEKLSELKYIAEQTESSFEAVAQGFKFLNRNMYEAITGNVKANEAFRALGITLKDEVTGNALAAEEVFLKIADRFKGLQDGSAKTALAMQIFGRGGQALIPVLNLGSEGITRLSQEAHRLGIVLTTENAKAIDAFSDGTKSLQAALGGLWLNISLVIIPALEKMVRFLTDAAVTFRKFSEAHPVLIKNLSTLALVFGALMLAIGPLLIALPPLITMFYAMDVALAPVLGTILIIAGAIGALTLIIANAKGLWGGFLKFLENRPYGPPLEIGSQPAAGETSPGAAAPETTVLDATVALVEKHAQALKEINEAYLSGKINAQQYYEAIKGLHADGLDIKQQELDLLKQSIELEQFAAEAEQQRIYVMQQGIQTAQEYYQVKAEMANQDLMDQQNTLSSMTNLLQTLQSMHKTIWQGIFDFVNMGVQKMSSGLSTAISSIILGTKTASEAFKEFGQAMLTAVVEFFVQWAVQALIAMTLGKLLSTWVLGQANAIAAAWFPAAVFASIATMGGADVAGAAGMTMAVGAGTILFAGMKSLKAAPMAEGGRGIVDRPTLFLAGEAGPERYNFSPVGKESGEGNTININFYDTKVASEIDINVLAEQLGYQIEERLRYARRA